MWCDSHKCGLAKSDLSAVSLCRVHSQFLPLFLSSCLILPACFQSAPPFQHIEETWLVHCTGTPLVSFALGPNKECPFSFSVAPFEVLPSTCKWGTAGGALKMVSQPPVLLCRLRLTVTEIKHVGGLTAFVRRRCHVNVGVRVHWCTYVIRELLGEGENRDVVVCVSFQLCQRFLPLLCSKLCVLSRIWPGWAQQCPWTKSKTARFKNLFDAQHMQTCQSLFYCLKMNINSANLPRKIIVGSTRLGFGLILVLSDIMNLHPLPTSRSPPSPYEPGPAGGFFLLKGLYKAPRDHIDCNRRFMYADEINKVKLKLVSLFKMGCFWCIFFSKAHTEI